MRASIAAIVSTCLALLLSAGLALANDDSIVIELRDHVVTCGELNDRFQVAVRVLAMQQGVSLADQNPSVIERLRVQYLDKHATELVMLWEADRRDVAASPEEVDGALDALRTSGIEGEILLRKIVQDEQTVQLMTELLLQEIAIPPGDVVTLHHDIKHTLITPEEVCVRHIQSASAEAAEEILAELERDADFAKLASERSEDEASAGKGGDLGCFQEGHVPAKSEFEKAAFEAGKVGVVGPIESEFGYHVIDVYEYKPPHELTLNEAFDDIERELKQEQLPRRVNTLISESGIKTYPENFAASDAGG